MSMGAAMIGGSVVSGLLSSNASSNAADAQADAAKYSANIQKDMYDQSRKDYMPFMEMGYATIPAYMQELGFSQEPGMDVTYVPGQGGGSGVPNAFYKREYNRLMSGSADKRGDQMLTGKDWDYLQSLKGSSSGVGSNGYWLVGDRKFSSEDAANKYAGTSEWKYNGFQEAPGYNYILSEGEDAINRAASAGGRSLSGSTVAELQRHAIGQADQGYQTHLNRLAGNVGQGGQAVNSMAGIGQNYATNAGNAHMAAGQAKASGYEGQANAFNSMIGNLSSIGMMNKMYPGTFF